MSKITVGEFLVGREDFLEKQATWLGTAAKYMTQGIKSVGNKMGKNSSGALRGDAAAASFTKKIVDPLKNTRNNVTASNFWKSHGGKVKGAGLVSAGVAGGMLFSGGKNTQQPRQINPPLNTNTNVRLK